MTTGAMNAERQIHEISQRVTTATGESLTNVLRNANSVSTPDGVLDAFGKFEEARAAVLADASRNADWKLSEVHRLENDIDTKLHELETAEMAKAFKDLDRQEGAIRGGLKGTSAGSDPALQAARAAAAATIANDLAVATTVPDASTLADLFDEAVISEHEERIRRVGAVVTAKLRVLALDSTADETLRAIARRVAGEYQAWRIANPSPATRLQDIAEQRARVEATVRQRYAVTRQRLRLTR